MKLDSLLGLHAEHARDTVSDAEPPPIEQIVAVRRSRKLLVGTAWTVVAGAAVVVAVVLSGPSADLTPSTLEPASGAPGASEVSTTTSVQTTTTIPLPVSKETLSQHALSVLASIDGATEVLLSSSRPDEHHWENLVVITEDRNTIEVWWQAWVPSDGADVLSEPGDDIQYWDDGTVAYIRDRSPEYVQVVFVHSRVLGSVILEAGTPLPDDFTGSSRPEETEPLSYPSADSAIALARGALAALIASGFAESGS